MKNLYRILIIFMIIIPSTIVIPQDNGFIVSGEISFPKTGDIYLQLLTENQYNGITDDFLYKIIKLTDEDLERKKVNFQFDSVPKGYYGIRCYQDINGDGKLNSGLFGPTEPWGTYKPSRPLFRGPTFDEVKFYVDKDITNIKFNIK